MLEVVHNNWLSQYLPPNPVPLPNLLANFALKMTPGPFWPLPTFAGDGSNSALERFSFTLVDHPLLFVGFCFPGLHCFPFFFHHGYVELSTSLPSSYRVQHLKEFLRIDQWLCSKSDLF